MTREKKEPSKIQSTIQTVTQKADSFLKNRIIASALMLYQGIMILLNAGHRSDGMVRGIAVSIALAAGTSIAQICASKGWKMRSLIPLVVFIVLAGVIYFFPSPMGFALRYLVALSVLAVGISNIAQSFHLTHTRKLMDWLKGKEEALLSEEKMPVSAQKTVQDEIDRHMNATVKLVKKVSTSSKLDCLLGIILVGLGVILLISPT